MTLRVRLFADPDKEHELPYIGNSAQEEFLYNCILDYNLRKWQRLAYPGACTIAYEHLLQIVIECLLGWDPKTQTGNVFGMIAACACADEEQGGKTLHSHWQIWVKDLNWCHDNIFHRVVSL